MRSLAHNVRSTSSQGLARPLVFCRTRPLAHKEPEPHSNHYGDQYSDVVLLDHRAHELDHLRSKLDGEKTEDKEEKNKNYYFSERAYGAFQRSFELPASVDRDKVAADFSKGVLTITLPKTSEARQQAKKIEVNAS